jgi:hypothetical protein
MPIKQQSLAQASPYVETAGRLRNTPERTSMHIAREAEIDARNTERMEAHEYTWVPGTNLDAPPPLPGMRQKWIRANIRTGSDDTNWQLRYREGWRPRDISTIPEDLRDNFPANEHSRQGVIQVGGLVLCHMAEARVAARTKAVRDIIRQQNLSISAETDKVSQEGIRAGVAPLERNEQVTAGSGRRPSTLAD